MLNLIIIALLIISAGIAAGSIIILSQFRKRYKSEAFPNLLYMQVFYYMFGFYALWGQVIIASYITPLIAAPLRAKVLEISILLGTPFIVFGWLMFLRFIHDFVQFRATKFFTAAFLILNFLILIGLGIWKAKSESLNAMAILRYYFIVSTLGYSLYAAITLLRKALPQKDFLFQRKRDFASGILLFSITQCISLLLYSSEIWLALVFIFLFFAGTAFLPVFIRYNTTVIPRVVKEEPLQLSFESFCDKFEISPREREIIREICNGLSNQQIADKLFISLQTVKDHTHRIYGKTMATGRMQLLKLVQQVDVNK
jgi:DNA-binding CsgD family transcriptional regulator